ncbi:heavy metal-associated isoprenylated plant protein 41-like [Apium graveolens]|uniref:heavy metal-associated isoprenylated plant protein 41-like n=1 Tax=Apium graveolens TaxID=4045 RepID=UPI003D7B0D74
MGDDEKEANQIHKQTHNDQQQQELEQEVEEKWVKYYSSLHQILLVGEGDFSFSACLAKSFGSASNIVASSLNSYDDVIKSYKNGESNLSFLDKLGASHLHEVDATEMKFHSDLRMRKFDRIIFNFPHAGFFGKEDNSLLIGMHKSLLDGFFRNASGMLRQNGEVHVTHKTSIPYCHWNLEELASRNALRLVECVAFKKEDYPGYENKRGSGSNCDKQFLLGECCTFRFSFSGNAKVTKAKQNMKRPQKPADPPKFVPRQPNFFQFRHPPSDFVTCMSGNPALNISYGRSQLLQTPTSASQQANVLELVLLHELFQTLIRASQQGNVSEHVLPRETHQTPSLIYDSQQRNILVHGQPRELLQASICANQQRNYLASRHPPSDLNLEMRGIPRCNEFPHIDYILMKCKSIFGRFFEQVVKALESPDHNSSNFLKEAFQLGYTRYIAGDPRGTPSSYAYFVEELVKFVAGRRGWQVSRQLTVENNLACNSRTGPFT